MTDMRPIFSTMVRILLQPDSICSGQYAVRDDQLFQTIMCLTNRILQNCGAITLGTGGSMIAGVVSNLADWGRFDLCRLGSRAQSV